MSRPLAAAGLALLCLSGCPAGGRSPEGTARRHGPTPLDSLSLASDARFDSLGFLAGSFVGEGTERAVHLLSSDTGLIGELARRYAPDLPAGAALWDALRARGPVAVGPRVHQAMVGSPLGHTEVAVTRLLLHGGRCGGAGAQAELVVQDRPEPDDPPLRGPVLGSILAAEAPAEQRGLMRRPDVPAPAPELVHALVERTRRDLDSTLAGDHPGLRLEPLAARPLEVNTLADFDAADVIPIRMRAGEVRYAVSLRERRMAGSDTLVEAGVTLWDSAGAWRQSVFRPVVLRLSGGRLEPYRAGGRPLYWRRLQPISDVAYPRDNIWMEQVDGGDGRVIWGVIQPAENVVVAAAEVGC
jgi:hypothetical protein